MDRTTLDELWVTRQAPTRNDRGGDDRVGSSTYCVLRTVMLPALTHALVVDT